VPPRGPELAGTRIAVVGGGSIGAGWAVVFARAGAAVALFEPDAERRAAVPGDLAGRLERLARGGLLDEHVSEVATRVALADSVDAVVDGAVHVQECAPERQDLKRELFAVLDAASAPDTVLASSSSMLTASAFVGELEGRARCLVAHPANPPYLLPVVELVPAPFTDADVLERTRGLFASAGMSPVVVAREVEGFVFNRLQGALLREAYCLVRDGVASVEDVDRVVREGPGRRWALMGPFETADLNTRGGIEAHAERLGPAYARMGAERGQHDPWTPELVARVAAELHRRLPLERWDERVARRDEALIELERTRRESGLVEL
jgi:3-hydroxyacyl-CoA dehydrogenase